MLFRSIGGADTSHFERSPVGRSGARKKVLPSKARQVLIKNLPCYPTILINQNGRVKFTILSNNGIIKGFVCEGES